MHKARNSASGPRHGVDDGPMRCKHTKKAINRGTTRTKDQRRRQECLDGRGEEIWGHQGLR